MFHRKQARVLSDDYERAHTVIQADKSVMSDACKALVLQDFTEKFFEYFEVDGLPMHANHYWLVDVLRGELGFDGIFANDLDRIA